MRHIAKIPVRWGDLDAMGHVNNTLYFRYFESLRIEWLMTVRAEPNPTGVGPVMANGFCNFIQQLEYPGDILARHYVASPGRSSFQTYITLERAERPGSLYASGGAKTVWVDAPTRRSLPLPASLVCSYFI